MNDNLPEVVYTPESQLRDPGKLIKMMWRDIRNCRELAWRLMLRDIRAKYRRSILGFFWAFLPPIATTVLFVVLNSRKIINIGETDIPYPAFVLIGTVLWQLFVQSLNAPLNMFTASKEIITKINFPPESLILSGIGHSLFQFSINLIILAIVFVIYELPISWGTVFSLPAVLALILLGTTLGLLLLPIGMLYTDISHGLTIATGFWFFITPVVYPAPTSFPFSLLVVLNPVSPILLGIRDLATQGVLHYPLAFFVVVLLSLLMLLLTWVAYRLAIPILVERMSA